MTEPQDAPSLEDLTEAARTPGSSVPEDFEEHHADTEKEGPDTESGQSDH